MIISPLNKLKTQINDYAKPTVRWEGNVTISEEYLMGPIPLPPSVWQVGTGLLGLLGLRRKIKK